MITCWSVEMLACMEVPCGMWLAPDIADDSYLTASSNNLIANRHRGSVTLEFNTQKWTIGLLCSSHCAGCLTCVDLPQPVAPLMTTTSLTATLDNNLLRQEYAGSLERTVFMLAYLGCVCKQVCTVMTGVQYCWHVCAV